MDHHFTTIAFMFMFNKIEEIGKASRNLMQRLNRQTETLNKLLANKKLSSLPFVKDCYNCAMKEKLLYRKISLFSNLRIRTITDTLRVYINDPCPKDDHIITEAKNELLDILHMIKQVEAIISQYSVVLDFLKSLTYVKPKPKPKPKLQRVKATASQDTLYELSDIESEATL